MLQASGQDELQVLHWGWSESLLLAREISERTLTQGALSHTFIFWKRSGFLAFSKAEYTCSIRPSRTFFSSLLGSTFLCISLSLWQTLLALLSDGKDAISSDRHSSLTELPQEEGLQRVSQGWISLARVVSCAHPCTNHHSLSLTGQTRSCVHHKNKGAQSTEMDWWEGQFFRENLKCYSKGWGKGCWMGKDTQCPLYFQCSYVVDLCVFVPNTH